MLKVCPKFASRASKPRPQHFPAPLVSLWNFRRARRNGPTGSCPLRSGDVCAPHWRASIFPSPDLSCTSTLLGVPAHRQCPWSMQPKHIQSHEAKNLPRGSTESVQHCLYTFCCVYIRLGWINNHAPPPQALPHHGASRVLVGCSHHLLTCSACTRPPLPSSHADRGRMS